MGGTNSKTEVNALSSQISNIAMSTVQDCAANIDQSQNLEVNNSGFRLWGNYKLQQTSEIKAECFSDVKKQVELQNKIINQIAQTSTAQGVALLSAFGRTNSDAITNLTNTVRNNITMSNIQKSYNNIKQTQSAKFTNSGIIGFEQVSLTQGAQIFAAATLTEMDKAGIFNSIESTIAQSSSAKEENPLDFIAKALGAVGSSLAMIAIFFVLIIAVTVIGIGYALNSGGKSGGCQDMPYLDGKIDL